MNPAFAICRSAAIVVDSVTKTNAVTESRVVESSAGRLPRGKIFEAAHNKRRTHLGVGRAASRAVDHRGAAASKIAGQRKSSCSAKFWLACRVT